MSYSILVTLGVNLLVGIGFIWYLRTLDKYHREPIATVSLLVVFGGISSMLLAQAGYFLTALLGFKDFNLILRSFIEIGPIEELAKLIPFIVFEKFFGKEIDEPIDGVIYIASIALGFALIENYLYALKDTSLIFIRSGLTSPMHISFSAIMGFVYVYNKNTSKNFQRIFKAYLIAVLLHSVYDAMVFVGIFSYWVFIGIIFFVMRIVNYSLWNSPFRKSLINQVSDTSNLEKEFCQTCNAETDQKKNVIEKISFGICETCGMVGLREKDFNKIMNYFVPGLLKEVRGDDSDFKKNYQAVVNDKVDKNYITFKVFKLSDFSDFLDESIVKLNEKFQKGKTYRFLFGEPLRGASEYYQNLSKEKIASEVKETASKITKSQQLKGTFVLFITFSGIFAFMALIFFVISFLKN